MLNAFMEKKRGRKTWRKSENYCSACFIVTFVLCVFHSAFMTTRQIVSPKPLNTLWFVVSRMKSIDFHWVFPLCLPIFLHFIYTVSKVCLIKIEWKLVEKIATRELVFYFYFSQTKRMRRSTECIPFKPENFNIHCSQSENLLSIETLDRFCL